MRLVCISDTHDFHRKLTIPDGDVLIHAGDITWQGELKIIVDFNAWLGTLPHKHKLVIAGNHDWNFQRNPSTANLLTNATYLQDSGIELEGLKFWGSPWQPAFCDWAFNLRFPRQLKEKWDLIPTDTDVLITHGPARGLLDSYPGWESRAGCLELRSALQRVEPKLHVCGHMHEGYGQTDFGPIKIVNASSCTLDYEPTNDPIVVEL